jgi:hypothetical protein
MGLGSSIQSLNSAKVIELELDDCMMPYRCSLILNYESNHNKSVWREQLHNYKDQVPKDRLLRKTGVPAILKELFKVDKTVFSRGKRSSIQHNNIGTSTTRSLTTLP